MTVSASPRRLPIIVGVAVLIVALVGAGLFWFSADERHDDAVRDLARAAVGCETTLDFARPGTYYVYLETAGTIETVAGDCSVATGPFELPRGDRPEVRLTLTDPAGQDVAITRSDGIAYEVDLYRGVQIGEVAVETAGDHVLAAGFAEDSGIAAVAVGGDPDAGTDALRGAAIAVLVVGLLVAGGLFVLAARRSPAQPSPVQPPFGPGSTDGRDRHGGRQTSVAPPSPPTGPPLRPPTEAGPQSRPVPPTAPPGGAEPSGSPWAPPAPRPD